MTPGRVGFYGKLPARGDFVRAGLPGSFVTPWDAWLQLGLTASRAALGQAWEPAWMEAPVWRFALAAGLCGPESVLGLWMPSVDGAGRHFPLTFATLHPDGEAGEGWLDAAEQAGLAALEADLTPDALAARLVPDAAAATIKPKSEPEPGRSLWWTEGAPRVAPVRRDVAGMPPPAAFAALLDDRMEAI